MQIIIAGCERVGAYLLRKLYELGHDMVVIEDKAESLTAIEDIDCIKIQAKAFDIEAQRQAGSETADVFLAVSSSENINVMAAEVAQMVFNVPRVIARTLNQENNQAFIDMGLETVCSTSIQANKIISMLSESEDHSTVDVFGTRMSLNKETLHEAFYGKTVAGVEASLECKIMAVLRDDVFLYANPNLVLVEDDVIILCEEANKI